jgi:hypothetical protein
MSCVMAWHVMMHTQAWLDSLLSPDTAVPDGAVAHISLGSRQLKAEWSQEKGSWVTTQVMDEHTPPAATTPVHLSLLFVDQPVARLPPAPYANNRPSMHRVSILLRRPQSAPPLTFVGSDASSAPPEQPGGSDDDGGPVTVQCVARGCWGTCLPVAVAGVEEEQAIGGGGENENSLIALTVSVQLWTGLIPLSTCSPSAAYVNVTQCWLS